MTTRRSLLRAIVGGAVLSATSISLIEAATENGLNIFLELDDGTDLEVRKVGDGYQASHVTGNNVNPQEFTLRTGEVIEVTDGVITKAAIAEGTQSKQASDVTFDLFVQSD